MYVYNLGEDYEKARATVRKASVWVSKGFGVQRFPCEGSEFKDFGFGFTLDPILV